MPFRIGPWELMLVFIYLLPYIWTALCLHIIANKTGTPNGWLAWIPIANIYLMCKVANKPGWWTILFFIPLVNIVIGITVWMGIAEARNQPSWLGILMIIPIVNFLILGILAFTSGREDNMVWLVAIASLYTLFLSSGILFSFFVFSPTIQIEFGWTAIELFIVLLISLFVIGVLFVVIRRFADTFGVKLAVSLGVLLLGPGCLLMSQIAIFWQLLVFWGIVVGAGIGSGIASVISALWAWLPNRKWFRFGILGVVLGLGILIIPLISTQFSMLFGWRTAYIIIGTIALFSLFPMIVILVIAQFLKRKQTA